jgi:hypothetical protein
LRAEDLRATVAGARRTALDRLFRRQVLLDGVLAVNLYGPHGRVTFSTGHPPAAARRPVAVNVTGRDLLDPHLADKVKDLLRKGKVPPSRLELEITENTVLTDPARARKMLLALSDFGVRLAVDDLGSGSSSLSYLKAAPDQRAQDRQVIRAADARKRRRGDRPLDDRPRVTTSG